MIPTEEALAEVVCEQDGLEQSPFGWFEPGEFGPAGAGRGLAGVRSAEQASGGEPEPDGGTAQAGVQGRGNGNGGAK